MINPPTRVVLARPAAQPTDPARLVDLLRQIRQHTFAGDTVAILTQLIATDWQYLQPGIHSTDRPAPTDGDVVEGIGVAAGNSPTRWAVEPVPSVAATRRPAPGTNPRPAAE